MQLGALLWRSGHTFGAWLSEEMPKKKDVRAV